MGRVFLARSDSGRTVAVKVVHEEHVSDEQFRARFRREIEAARKVGERYTAPVLDAGPGDEPPWVATGYVPGLSLEQIVRRYGPLPAESLHALAEGLLKALKDIHGAGIVHRDLKPSNVMLTVDGTKVIDFGIARALETSVESLLTSTGMAVGSPGFMSPEQVRGQSAGVKSDVFTLGCVLTYAATGQLPFGHGASNQHAVMFQIVEGEPDLAGVEDDSLRALITRCLTKDIDQRPGVDELLADPQRTRPSTARGAWLPARVVARLAQQSARLLDAEAAPLREEPVDRATIGLRPQAGPPGGVVAEGVVATARTRTAAPPPSQDHRAARHRRAHGRGRHVRRAPALRERRRRRSARQAAERSAGASAGASAPRRTRREQLTERGEQFAVPGGAPATRARATRRRQNDRPSGGSSAPPGGGRRSRPAAVAAPPGVPGRLGGGSGSSGPAGSAGASGGSGSSGSTGSSAGSPPADMKGYKVTYDNSCVGACSMPLTVSWSTVSGATSYDIHYTNKGSNFTKKNVDTVYSTGGTSYTINGPFSGDEICVAVRAANKYGPSAWAETWCGTVPY